jgi:hypothetical protein
MLTDSYSCFKNKQNQPCFGFRGDWISIFRQIKAEFFKKYPPAITTAAKNKQNFAGNTQFQIPIFSEKRTFGIAGIKIKKINKWQNSG